MIKICLPDFELARLEPTKVTASESLSYDNKGMEEIRSAMEILTGVDLDIVFCSEKLLNLDTLLMHVLLLGNDSDQVIEYDNISLEALEKALEIDLLHAIVKSEVKVLDNFMGSRQALIIDARNKISTFQDLEDTYIMVQSKLHDTEETLKQSRDHILEMKMQLAKLQMASLAFNQNEYLSKEVKISGIYLKPELQSVEKQHILRMLEKSLARELDFEKKLIETKQNEEDLKLKLRLTEQVALCMEEAAEVIWARFLEAENTAEVLMGISKEMVGRLQVVQFTLDTSINREQDMNCKLQDYAAKLNAKDMEIGKLCSELSAQSSEVATLKANVSLLGEQLRESMSKLEEANTSNETSQEHLVEMESIIESLKETIDVAESRAENAEAKVNQLTETNLELTEEVSFLKGSNDGNAEKLSGLEKQLRDLELQLQHAKASSEASQEQQNMLYSAIWDMETLIDELKQKVSKAEGKTENAEEQCVILSETNLELNKEVEFLRNKVEFLEMSLDQATIENMASAKDISIKSNIVMDMVMQLAVERERIQQKFYNLAKENKLLVEKLRKAKKGASTISRDGNNINNKEISTSRLDSPTSSCKEASDDKAAELPAKGFQNQVKESLDDASAVQTEMQFPDPSDHDDNNSVKKLGTENRVEAEQSRRRRYMYMAISVPLLSALAVYLFDKQEAILKMLNG